MLCGCRHKGRRRAGETAQWVEELAAKPEALTLILRTCMVDGGDWLPQVVSAVHAHIHCPQESSK